MKQLELLEVELKNIIPYLPYKLNIYAPYLIWSGNPPEPSHEEYGETEIALNNCLKFINSGFPFVLCPLSDLSKEELNEFTACFRMYYNKSNFDYKLMTYSDAELCFKKHIDIFGLIDKGLAISSTELTLNK